MCSTVEERKDKSATLKTGGFLSDELTNAFKRRVRFRGYSGHRSDIPKCPLLTQSRHSRLKIAAVQLEP